MRIQIKHIALTLTLMSIALLSTAQKDLRFGFKISPNYSWTKSNTESMDADGGGIGFSYGLMTDIAISDNASFSIEAIVTSMRSKFKMKDSLSYTDATSTTTRYGDVGLDYKLQYIQIPLSIKLKTGEIGKVSYFGQMGLAPSFLIGSKLKISSTPDYPESDYYLNNDEENVGLGFNEFNDKTNFLRLPMILGAGLEYNISGNTSIVAGLRFDNSFLDMLNDKDKKAINNYLGLHLGVFF